jgi:beta-lactamase superfamily II metal-dependent hydrolase
VFAGCPPDAEGGDTKLRVHFIDVGQGDCIFITTPNDSKPGNGKREGYRILIDAGKPGHGNSEVIPYLRGLGLGAGDTIHWVIASHADQDHVGGLPEVYDTFVVVNTLDPGLNLNKTPYQSFRARATAECGPRYWRDPLAMGRLDSLGDTIDLGSELQTRVLFYKPHPRGDSVNKSSLVLRLRYKKRSFLFMGDAPTVTEESLMTRYGDSLRSTVLKVGHHGSKSATSDDFLARVQPAYAVIMSGRQTFGGHCLPDDEVVERLEAACDSAVLRTDHDDVGSESEAADGDNIVITTSGNRVWVSGP